MEVRGHGLIYCIIMTSACRDQGNPRKNLVIQSAGRNFKRGPPEYEAGILTTRPQYSVVSLLVASRSAHIGSLFSDYMTFRCEI
jgi:hypothetical protein